MNRVWFIILLAAYVAGTIYLSFRVDRLSEEMKNINMETDKKFAKLENNINKEIDELNAKLILQAGKLDKLERKKDFLNENIIIDNRIIRQASISDSKY